MAVYKGKCDYVNCAMEFDNPQDLYVHVEESHMTIPLEMLTSNVPEGHRPEEAEGGLLDDVKQNLDDGSDEQVRAEAGGQLREEVAGTESAIEDAAGDEELANEASPSTELHEEGHDNAPRVPICPVAGCQKTFKNFSSILFHMRDYHRNESVFSCNICEKSFMSFGHLKNHIEHHQSEYEKHLKHESGLRSHVFDNCPYESKH